MSFLVPNRISCDLLVEQCVLHEIKLADLELAQSVSDKIGLGQKAIRHLNIGDNSYQTRGIHDLLFW